MLNRNLYTNTMLFNFKKVDSPLCSFCVKELETIEHLFFHCTKVGMFWEELKAVLNSLNIIVRYDIKDVLFGILDTAWPEISDIWAHISCSVLPLKSWQYDGNQPSRSAKKCSWLFRASIVLYNYTTERMKTGKKYLVERIIERRETHLVSHIFGSFIAFVSKYKYDRCFSGILNNCKELLAVN